MDYEHLWKVLEGLMVELTEKGVTISKELMDSLKAAKSYISIYKTNPTELEIVDEIEGYIGHLEPNLLYLAEMDMGKDYAEKWMEKVNNARLEETPEPTVAVTKFLTAIPKGEHWIRINLSGLINDEEVHEFLEMLNLSSKPQENGYLVIHGREENVKTFIKKISEKIRKK